MGGVFLQKVFNPSVQEWFSPGANEFFMEALVEFFFPGRCAGCGRYEQTGICAECESRIPPTASFFSFPDIQAGLALGPHLPPLRDAVLALKFKQRKYIGETLGALLAARVKETGWKPHGIVPAPMPASRSRERGYNHAEVLARSVAVRLGVPCMDWLCLTRPLAHQLGLGRAKRLANVRGAFALRGGARLLDKTLLLVDDVATTGATLSECARALKQGGAGRIYAACASLDLPAKIKQDRKR